MDVETDMDADADDIEMALLHLNKLVLNFCPLQGFCVKIFACQVIFAATNIRKILTFSS